MASYTIEVNTDSGDLEAGLQYVVSLHNDSNNSTLDAQQYLTMLLENALLSYAQALLEKETAAFNERYITADRETRTALSEALTILGVKIK